MTHFFSPQGPNSCYIFSSALYLWTFSHSQRSRGMLLLGEQKNSWPPLTQKSPDYFRQRTAWSDSLASLHVVPGPELLPIYDNVISFAFRDALYAPSVRLTQKYVCQAKYLTSPSDLHCIWPSGRT